MTDPRSTSVASGGDDNDETTTINKSTTISIIYDIVEGIQSPKLRLKREVIGTLTKNSSDSNSSRSEQQTTTDSNNVNNNSNNNNNDNGEDQSHVHSGKLNYKDVESMNQIIDACFATLQVHIHMKEVDSVLQVLKHIFTRLDSGHGSIAYFIKRLQQVAKQQQQQQPIHKYTSVSTLLQWSLIVIGCKGVSSEQITQILTVQSSLFALLGQSQFQFIKSKFVTRLLEEKRLIEIYKNYLTTSTDTTTSNIYFMSIYMQYIINFNNTHLKSVAEHKEFFLNYYNKVVLGSTQPISIEKHQFFIPLFKIIDLNDFNLLLATISRVIKRSPEETTLVITLILEHITFDINTLIKSQLIPLLIPVLQVATINRKTIKNVFTNIVNKTKEYKLLSIEDLLKALSTPGNVAFKLNTLYALKVISSNSFELNDNQAISKLIITAISIYIDKEFTKLNRIQIFKVIGKWLKYYEQPIPDSLIKSIGNSLKSDEDVIKAAAIRSLSQTLGEKVDVKKYEKKITAINTTFTEVIYTILKNIKNAQTCETSTTSAAIDYMLSIATTPVVGTKYASDKNIVQLIYGSQSFVHQTGFLHRTTMEDQVPLFFERAISLQKSFPTFKPSSEKSIYTSLVYLSLHPSNWNVRRSAILIIKQLTKPSHSTSTTTTTTTNNNQNQGKSITNILYGEYVKILELASNGLPRDSVGSVGTDIYSSSLKAILSKDFDMKLLPSLVLVANHPFVKTLPSCFAILGFRPLELFTSDVSRDIVQYIFGNQGLGNKKNPLYQQAFVNTLETFGRLKIASFIEQATTMFIKSFDLTPLNSLTQLQLAIYNTKEGELYEDSTAVQTKSSTAAERRGKVPKKKTAEEIKEEEFKKRQEEKKKKESGEDERLEKERQKAIQEQSQVRKEVQQTIQFYKYTLEALDRLVNVSPLFVGEYIGSLYLPLIDLFKNDFTNEIAMKSFANLARTIPARFKVSLYYAQGVTYLIDNIYHKPVMSDIILLSTLQRTLQFVKEITSREPIPASAFNLFWPIIKNGLEKTISLTIQELSIEITERHSHQFSQHYPRGSMISSLIVVLATNPRLEERAKSAIFQIINGVEESDIKELMEGLVSKHHQVRLICLQALERIPSIHSPSFPWEDSYIAKMWFVRFDSESATSALAEKIWNGTNLKMPQDVLQAMSSSIYNSSAEVRKINASAIRSLAAEDPKSIKEKYLDVLIPRFESCIPDGIRDTRQLQLTRISIATLLGGIGCAAATGADLKQIFEWMMNTGLNDPFQDVTNELTQTGSLIISEQGKRFSAELLSIFEQYLSRPDNGSEAEDSIRAAVVVFMASLAKHMEDTNPRVITIIDKLVESLSIPSEPVQITISKGITQLLAHFKKQGERLIPILINNIKMSQDYATRRGNAFGVAGAIKGLGISSLKTYDVLAQLTACVEDKKHPGTRQGGLFAFECLCNTLGRVFEPYVIQILPKLLVLFGDNDSSVRLACSETARAIMSQLSGHGVKIVLPALLKALDDRQWRTKEGSIELLGAMAFCAPKQLSTCLPTIVPKLTNVLNDTHIKVQEAAKLALQHIGSVIRNPEIQIHVPLVLKTYDEPDLYSRELLENLLNTNYIHTIDPASLSLIMPILERTLKERSSEVKKMTCQIVGNLCSLTEPKELIPYMSILMPTIKNVLLDPIPEVRAICARALGLLVRGMGEDNFTDLVPWLLETVKSDIGPVERSGAAQGLSEVLASLDIQRFNSLIGELINMSNSTRPHVREGILSMFIFTPISFGDAFLPYLPKVLPQVLKGLADEHEPVREVCMRCGHSIITQFSITGIEVIVPSLERVLFHENWRIRLSCVQLFGDLLYKLSGSAPSASDQYENTNSTADDLASSTSSSPLLHDSSDSSSGTVFKPEIYKLLGKERLDRILSSLYLMRFDTNASVRQKVLLIWKFVVNNTPKTLRDILPSLVEMIIQAIGSSNIDKRQVAAKTLGDVVAKLGDRILPEIMPILERGLESDEEETRQGVCIGLTEVISSARTMLLPFLGGVVMCIGRALADQLVDVREAAAHAFDQLYITFGSKASNEIIPPLIAHLDSKDPVVATNALDGLRQIIVIKSAVVLPFIIPKLLARPISTANVQALASLSSDAGAGLYGHIPTIISTLIEAFTSQHIENSKEIRESAIKICRSIDAEGLETLVPLLIEQTEVRLPAIRLGACQLLGEFCAGTTLDFEDYTEDMIVALLKLFDDPDKQVQVQANQALLAVTKTIKKENLQFLSVLQSSIKTLAEEVDQETKLVPAFCIPKGMASVLGPLLNGLRYGTAEQREMATNTLYQVINLTSQDVLKASVMEITGPLILTIGDKFPWTVKSAILQCLSLLITKCPASMKIFLHQLQPTFIKALGDPNKFVRNNAASALGLLMTLSPSVDQLVNSLILGIGTADSTQQEVKLKALQSIFEKKPKIEQANLDKCLAAVADFLFQQSDDLRHLAAKVVGASSRSFASLDVLNNYIKQSLLSPSASVLVRYGKSVALCEVMRVSGATIVSSGTPNIAAMITTCQVDAKDEKAPVRESSCLLAESILMHQPTFVADLIPSVSHLISDQATHVAITALNVVKRFAKQNADAVRPYLSAIVPPIMNRLKERSNLPLKLASERALVHSLQIFKESVVLDDYLKTVNDSSLSTSLIDYHKRILMKLSPDSDNETY